MKKEIKMMLQKTYGYDYAKIESTNIIMKKGWSL